MPCHGGNEKNGVKGGLDVKAFRFGSKKEKEEISFAQKELEEEKSLVGGKLSYCDWRGGRQKGVEY